MQQLEIGIAGAGIGGLCAGAAMADAGHAVTIYDQFETPRPLGSGLVIQPVGQAVLDLVGAGDQARAFGNRINRLSGYEADQGRKVLSVDYDRGNKSGRYGLAIHRAALFHCLMQAAQTSGAQIQSGHQIAMVTKDKKRRLNFKDGSQSQPFDLIIEATGANSPLSPLKSRAVSFGALWGTVNWPTDTILPRDQLSQCYRASNKMLGVLPIGQIPDEAGEKTAIFWSLPRGNIDEWKQGPLSRWQGEAIEIWPDFADFLDEIDDHDQMTPAIYSHGHLRKPYRRGLIHIGDAAHRASPQLGQGANMALLDAYALSLALENSVSIPDALVLYHSLRKRHLWIYQLMSYLFTPLYQSDSRHLPWIRDRILTPLTTLPIAQSILSRLVCGDLVSPIKGRPVG